MSALVDELVRPLDADVDARDRLRPYPRPRVVRNTDVAPRITRQAFLRWLPALLSLAGALGLSLYFAVHNYEVDIDVYRMGGLHALLPNLYTTRFGNSGLLFTYTPFAALVFALPAHIFGLWSLQVVWALTNIAAFFGLIYLSIRIVVPRLGRSQAVRLAMLFLLPGMVLNPLINAIGLGQIDIVLCLLIMWDLGTDRRIGTRTMPLGIGIGLAAAVKLTPLIFVPYLLITRRGRGAVNAITTFMACEALAFVMSPHNSWLYWTKDVFDSKRAGVLVYASDQNVSSVLQRFHHGPVSSLVLVPAMIAIGIGGLVLAAWAHRRSSVVLGILVCATTGLIISPITWVHHLVWVVPAIIWMAAGADRPRGGRLLAGFATVLFIAAPIWWTPVSWSAAHYPPELRWDHWQLLFGNSFFFALVAFLVGVAVMLKRRGNVSLRRPPALATIGHLDPWHGPVRPLNNRGHGENQRNDDIVDPDTEGLELVGSRRSEAVNSRA